MTDLPSNAEVVAALRQLFSNSPVMLAGSPEAVAEEVLRIVRLAATQEQRGEPEKPAGLIRCRTCHGLMLPFSDALSSSKSDTPTGNQ